MARLALGCVVLFSAITLVVSCSSGLGRNPRRAPTPLAVLNPNRPTGLDLGVAPADSPAQPAVAGVVVPAIGDTAARDVMLLAFTTSSPANDADGTGRALVRDTVTDTNGASDVFVAAISAQDIETRAFSQSLAGKFRHPRCATCHSMQSADSTAFVSSLQPHAGPTPGSAFPNNAPSICTQCHGSSQFDVSPVPLWQAPATSFDFRRKTVAELAAAADDTPTGDISHFRDDPRVLWALDSGLTPTFGGRNGVADDDHDGVLEPEDSDGTPRPVPGGAAVFLRQIQDYIASGRTVTTARAVMDVTLASRSATSTGASNGASTTPRLLWVPNGAFDPTNATTARNTNPIGTLFVAYASTGSDIAGTDGNGASDVFRAALELRAEEAADGTALAGGLNLVYLDGNTVLCSARSGTTTAGNGAATQPTIGGSTGDLVAFTSVANDLIPAFVDANGPSAADVYVRRIGSGVTTLASHSLSGISTTGDGHSEQPALDATGTVVAFATDATNLAGGDSNGARDVYYADISGSSPFTRLRASLTATGTQANGGPSSAPSVHVIGTRVRVAFQSDATDLTTGLTATTNVYLFDSATGASTLLNQQLTPDATAIGDGSARTPVLAADGAHVAFESDATNIDAVRGTDLNHAADIFLVDTSKVANGVIAPFRLSVTTREGADGNGASTAAAFGSFANSSNFPAGFVAYRTDATNLGTSDTTKLMVGFLAETALLADFTSDVTRGQAPLTVTFADASSGAPTAWAWDFDGDGTVDSTVQNPPAFTYQAAGSYTASLVVTKDGRTASHTATILAVATPTPSFTVSATTGLTTTTFQFTDTSTQSPTAWQWDFDDNGSIDSTLRNPTKVYTSPGTYSVRLTVTNEAGSATTTQSNLITVFLPVSATFNASTTSGAAPLTVNFTNTSTGATSYSWDFGDGTATSTATNPSHVFNSGGTFSVILTATGPGGVSTSAPTSITVTSTASFTVSTSSGAAPLTVNFTNTSTGGSGNTYVWNFGDGSPTVTTTNASHSYTTGGIFTATLTVNGSSSAQQSITVSFTPSFTITGAGVNSTPAAYEATSVTFTASSTGNPTSFSWAISSTGAQFSSPDTAINVGTLTLANSATASRTFANTTVSQRVFTITLTVSRGGVSSQTSRTLTIVSDTETTSLTSVADCTIYQEATNNSNGAGSGLFVGRTAGSLTQAGGGPAALSRRGLLRFNVSSIPSNSTITAATVDLSVSQALDTGARTIGFFRLINSWTEGTASGTGQGAAAAGGGATWANRTTPSTAWSAGGGLSGTDFVSSATATISFAAGLTASATSGSLASDVQLWVNTSAPTAPNNGWMLIGNEAVLSTVKRILAREAGAGAPTLNVTYTRPLP